MAMYGNMKEKNPKMPKEHEPKAHEKLERQGNEMSKGSKSGLKPSPSKMHRSRCGY